MTKDTRFENAYYPDMEGREVTMCEVLDRVEEKGKEKILSLMNYLLSNNRIEDAKKAVEDKTFRDNLLAEISDENQNMRQ